MKNRTIISVLLMVISVVLTIVSYVMLPDVITTQLSLGGNAATMPKIIGIAIPALLGIGGALGGLFIKESNKSTGKPLIVSCVGIGVFILMLAVNH